MVEIRNASILFVVVIVAMFAGHAALGQEPIERDPLDLVQSTDLVALIASQTEVMQQMSEKLSRIETIVTDTNSKVATRADVDAILAKLETMKLNTASPAKTVITEQVIPTIVTERVIPKVTQSIPVEIPIELPISQPSPPVSSPGEVIIERKFGSDITAKGDNIDIRRGPLGLLRVTTDSAPMFSNPCQTGQCTIPMQSTCSFPAMGSSNCYNPNTVTAPYNDGRGISNGNRTPCGLLRRIFGRR